MGNSLIGMITGGILIVLVSTVFFVAIMEGSNYYGVEFPDAYKSNFESVNATLEDIQFLSQNITGNVEESSGFQGSTDIRIDQKIVAAIKLPKNMIGIFSSMITQFANTVGIPDWIIGILVLLITVSIIGLIIGAVLRKDIV